LSLGTWVEGHWKIIEGTCVPQKKGKIVEREKKNAIYYQRSITVVVVSSGSLSREKKKKIVFCRDCEGAQPQNYQKSQNVCLLSTE